MMLWMIILRKKIVYVPTTCRRTAGFFSAQDPVIFTESKNKPEIINGIKEIVAKGNPVIPTPKRSEYSEPVLLKYAAVKT